MAEVAHHAIRSCLTLVCGTLFPLHCVAQPHEDFEISARKLLVVLRESHGENKQDESLQPFGKLHATMADGREIELATGWYRYVGNMHIRLVFDGAGACLSSGLHLFKDGRGSVFQSPQAAPMGRVNKRRCSARHGRSARPPSA